MKVISVRMSNRKIYVDFMSNECLYDALYVVTIKSITSLKQYYFTTDSISSEGENLCKVTAKETGYERSKASYNKVDLRKLLNCEVRLVTDEETIDLVKRQSDFC